MPFSPTTPAPCQWFSYLAALLDVRSASRLLRLFLGAVLAVGRRTVTSWLRAAGVTHDYRPAYTTVAAAGKRTDLLAARLAYAALRPMLAGAERLTFGIDDTPTRRYGPHVEGAGVHHHPTPGPAAARFVYGHVWVVLGWLARHPAWGAIALPLLARLYVRRKDLPRVPPDHRPAFRTKLELAVELVRWAVASLGFLRKPLWVAADGAYAKAAFLKPLRSLGVTVVSRLRKDAALCSVPGPRRPGRRGPDAPLRRTPPRPGQAGRPGPGLAIRRLRPVRQAHGQDLQDLPGHLAAGRRPHPGGAGPRAARLARLLLHRPGRHRGRRAGLRRRPLQPGDGLPRPQGDGRGRAAAGPVPVGQRRGVPPVPVDLHDDRGVGVGPVARRSGGPIRGAVGRPGPPTVARRQAAGLAAATAGRGNPGRSPARDDRSANRGGR